jgi:hypothetical protein
MFLGVLNTANFEYTPDTILVLLYPVSFLFFYFGILINRTRNSKVFTYKVTNQRLTQNQNIIIFSIIIFSIIINLWYFSRIDISIYREIFSSILSFEDINITNYRLSTYQLSGTGYVYQFRVILLPILTAYLISNKNEKLHKFGLFILPIMFIFLIATGQRGGFVIFVIIWVSYFLLMKKYFHEKVGRYLLIISIVGISIFGFVTILNGRNLVSGSFISAIFDRAFLDNQQTALQGFRYIYNQNIVYGKDWIIMIINVTPFKIDYLPLPYQIFNIMYGSTRGTAPSDIWGSAWYNFGIFGVTGLSFLIGFFYNKIDKNFRRGNITPFRTMLYAGMAVIAGTWVAEGPVVLFNQGFVTLVILYAITSSYIFTIRRFE